MVARADQVLVDFGKNFDLASVESHDAKAALGQGALRLDTGSQAGEAGITIKSPASLWDLSSFQEVATEVKNVGDKPARVFCRLDAINANGSTNYMAQSVEIKPGEQKMLRVAIPQPLSRDIRQKLFGMRGIPQQISIHPFDAAKVCRVAVYVGKSGDDHSLELTRLTACGTAKDAVASQEKNFFPLIDTFGQYMHKDWPGKIHSVADFDVRKKDEAADLAAHPGPNDWDAYGGWKAGPQQKATGFFRTEKIDGKWWLVDPEGRLFWSNGITCVRARDAVTPITDRKHWYADLPEPGSPLAQFYGKGHWGPHNYHEGQPCEEYDFSGANLLRKYGEGWEKGYRELAAQRLRSWGINTIANWSDSEICALHKASYTASIGTGGRSLPVTDGWWGRFNDVFDPSFVTETRKRAASHSGRPLGDPWCIGFFSDNEMSWGTDGMSLAIAALRAPADQPAKLAFVDDLRKKYETIDKLNEAWGTQHASWDALLQSTTPPDKNKAKADLKAFYTRIAERYFQVTRDAIKEVAPNQLYLGCRFASFGQNDDAIRAAAKYCDVISFNVYKHTADLRLPEGVDKPIIIGEFHVGALDRGMFHTGLTGATNQEERAQSYKSYLEGALGNPWIVGAHWFQYMDQATTGRGDGENYQIGFVDSCDTPNPEIIGAARQIGDEMYPRRKQ
jgi:hypothetical protein